MYISPISGKNIPQYEVSNNWTDLSSSKFPQCPTKPDELSHQNNGKMFDWFNIVKMTYLCKLLNKYVIFLQY